MRLRPGRAIALLLLGAAGCATAVEDDAVPGGFGGDAAADSASDAGSDSKLEGGIDAPGDTGSDHALPDAPDAGPDGAFDAPPDVPGDVSGDAAVDTGADAPGDANEAGDAPGDGPLDPNSRDPLLRCSGVTLVTPLVAPAGTAWATSVDSFSSEYGSPIWSSTQALGAPDSYPGYGDLTTAWASLASDGAGEYLAVAFTPAVSGSAVWIYETYNPDAVSRVTITTGSGDSVIYQPASVASIGTCAFVLIVPTVTGDAISKVRVELASEQVSTWNEIDAVGIVP